VLDVAGAAWTCANWMAREGRKSANLIAGQPFLFHYDKSKVKDVDGMIPPDEKPVAPLFNLVLYFMSFSGYVLLIDIALQVDDSQSTLLSTGQIISAYFGTTLEFFSLVESTVFKVRIFLM
jgi:hypothetical protein